MNQIVLIVDQKIIIKKNVQNKYKIIKSYIIKKINVFVAVLTTIIKKIVIKINKKKPFVFYAIKKVILLRIVKTLKNKNYY
jgi:hypothetical protein